MRSTLTALALALALVVVTGCESVRPAPAPSPEAAALTAPAPVPTPPQTAALTEATATPPPVALEPLAVAAVRVESAAPTPPPPPRTVIGKVRARARPGDPHQALGLTAVSVEASIGPALASIEIAHVFANPHEAIMEGLYEVTLPAGASVARYALGGPEGEWLEGRFVERQLARRAYESYLPQNRDPGLVEWQDGERFSARVFPIPASSDKHVLLGYTEPARTRAGVTRWELPLGDTLATIEGPFEATVRVGLPGAETDRVRVVEHPGTARIEREGEEVVVRVRGAVPGASRIVIEVDAPGRAEPRLLFAMPERESESEDGWAVVLLDPRELLDAGERLPSGADFVFVLDRSGSMSARLAEATRQLAGAIEALGPDDRFSVIAFSDAADVVTAGFLPADRHVGALVAANLSARGTTGGTQFGPAFAAAAGVLAGRDAKRPAVVVLLTDGEGFEDVATAPGAPLFAVPIGDVDRHALDLAARAHGGRALGTASEAVAAAPHRALATIAAALGEGAGEIHPRVARVFDPEERITFAARVRPDEEGRLPRELKLTIETGGASRETTLALGYPEPVPAADAGRIWARARIADLLREPAAHAEELTALGERYRFVTPFTSLLVLESEQEYRKWGIEQPAREIEDAIGALVRPEPGDDEPRRALKKQVGDAVFHLRLVHEQRQREQMQRFAIDKADFEKARAQRAFEATLRGLFRLAEDAFDTADYGRCAELCGQILDLRPDDGQTKRLHEAALAATHLVEERERQARNELVQPLLKRIIEELKANDYARAEKTADEVLAIDPDSDMALRLKRLAIRGRHVWEKYDHITTDREEERRDVELLHEAAIPYADRITWPDEEKWDAITARTSGTRDFPGPTIRAGASSTELQAGMDAYNRLDYAEAERHFEQAAAAGDPVAEQYHLLSQLLIGKRDPEFRASATQLAEQRTVLIEQKKIEVERLFGQGAHALAALDLDEAVARFEEVLEQIRWFPYPVASDEQQARAAALLEVARRLRSRRVTLDYPDARIRDVVAHLAAATGLEVRVADDVDRDLRVTISVRDLRSGDALSFICKRAGLKTTLAGEAIVLTPR